MARRVDYLFRETVTGLRRNGLVGFAAMSTVFISLFLLGGALLIGRQVGLVVDATTANVEVAVYLQDTVSQSQVQHLMGILRGVPAVDPEGVSYESKDQAYARFKQLFANQTAMLQNVSPDALPASIRVKLDQPDQFEEVSAALGCTETSAGTLQCTQPGIDKVVDQRETLKRLFAVIRVFRVGVGAVAVVMMISAAALIANTVRMGLFARRKEIGIMKLVGATNWRIRMPFIVEALFEGLLGALGAILALFILKVAFIDPLRGQIGFMPLIQNTDVVTTIPYLLGAGAVVAVVASLLAMRRFLDV
jgi:cell division transport system permease protein